MQEGKYISLLETTQNTRDLGGYRTKNGAVTKVDNVDDDCRNAVLYTYDLSQFKDKTVEVTIKNVAVQDQGYDDRLIIGSVGFTSVLRVTESLNWAANTIKETGYTSNLQVLPVGAFSIYNEGINFRTQDFAGGITRTFDLSDSQLENKTVKVQVGFRNFNSSGEDIEFQMLLNGILVETQNKTINEELTLSGYKAFVDTMNCSAVSSFFVKPYLRPISQNKLFHSQ